MRNEPVCCLSIDFLGMGRLNKALRISKRGHLLRNIAIRLIEA